MPARSVLRSLTWIGMVLLASSSLSRAQAEEQTSPPSAAAAGSASEPLASPPAAAAPTLTPGAPRPSYGATPFARLIEEERYALLRSRELKQLERALLRAGRVPALGVQLGVSLGLVGAGVALSYVALFMVASETSTSDSDDVAFVLFASGGAMMLAGGAWSLTLLAIQLSRRLRPEVRAVREERKGWARRYRELQRLRERGWLSLAPHVDARNVAMSVRFAARF